MKVIDVLVMAESLCRLLADNNIDPTDVRYIELYRDWVRMRAEGHKYSYIVYYLSIQYDVSESSVNRIVKRMNKEINI